MEHHHARGPEETVCDLPPVVPAEPASGTPPTCLREAGMPDVAPTENPSQLAPPEPRLRHRLADRPTRGADPIPARTVAVARAVETSSGRISLIRRDFPAHSPFRRERPVPAWAILNPQATMQLEFHQLDRRWEHLRVRQPHRQRRLMASLAESGQQAPIVVVLSPGHRDRYLVIDGHKRIAALQQLGRDTVEATVWAMSDAEALLLDRSLRFSPQESALGLLTGGVGAALRPQRELGVAALGVGRVAAGKHPAAGARGSDRGATGDQVSGAGSARQPGAVRANGRRFRPAPLRHAASRTTLCRLAGRLARGPRAHLGRAGTVFENAAAATVRQAGRGGCGARTGDGGGHPASRRPAARRSPAGDGPPATGTSTTSDRKRAPGTGPDGDAHRKGTASQRC